ncbi:MAG: glycoside hydrolase family 127 protein [Armatimonadota bacterium]|nr:glycoside hydrolase family 127 protein [Armatimonadota bacterium]
MQTSRSSPMPGCLTPLPFTQVRIDDRFWSPRLRVNREKTLAHQYQQCKETGRIDAFRLDWRPGREPVPHIFWDSDVAKWVEAASYTLALHPDPHLENLLDEVVALIASAQQPDGYLNVHFTVVEPEKRWTNLRDWHELYCAGHLMEAAVAHYQATGKRTLLNALCRYADYIGTVFGTGPGQKRGYPGHEEIELALVKLFRVTGERRYLELSRYFVEERGRQPHYFDQEARARGEDPARFHGRDYRYNQSHLPVREQTEVVGHAVRAMYLYCAMADLAGELNDPTLLRACERLWESVTGRRMYVTGGIGSARANEGFTFDYDLPNESAYAETCAAIGLVFWAHRLLQLTADARYADVMERALYNGVLSGVSLDGERFFYVNPLASVGDHHRQPWFGCACCPPNVARLLASLGHYIYSRRDDDVAVHLYIQSSAQLTVGGGAATLTQSTEYPWEGRVCLAWRLERPARFAMLLRIPGWCREARLWVNGSAIPLKDVVERGYARVAREWRDGDRVELDLPMRPERIYAHPAVRQNVGRVALQRGPLVYCLEEADHPVSVHRLLLPRNAPVKARFDNSVLGGVVLLEGEGVALRENGWEGALYRATPPDASPCLLTAVPYFAWDNRAPGTMTVWIPEPTGVRGGPVE